MVKRYYIWFLGLLIPAACTVKRDALLNRNYQRMVTHYNVLFNATERLEQGVQKGMDAYRDDYTKRLKLLPYKPQHEVGFTPTFGTSSGARQSGPLTTAEEKAQRAIDDHSMYIKGAERNAMIDDAYMTLGKARYFQDKPIEALEAFNYVRTFIRGGDRLVDAVLWSAKAKLLAGNVYGAMDDVNAVLKQKEQARGKQLEEAHKLAAAIFIRAKRWKKAIGALEAAKHYAGKRNRIRYTYLQAQLYGSMGQRHKSSKVFGVVVDMKPDKTTEVFSCLHRAANFRPGDGNRRSLEGSLKRFLKLKRYWLYYADIYRGLGALEEALKDTTAALAAYEQAVESKAFYKKDKGLAYVRLMDFSFGGHDFSKSARYADSALALLPAGMQIAKRLKAQKEDRKQALSLYERKVRGDSLLRLAALPRAEQRKIIRAYIKKRKRKRAKQQLVAASEVSALQDTTDSADRDSKKGQWYFYNPRLRARGFRRFGRLWGRIGMRDDWRFQGAAGQGVSLSTKPADSSGKGGDTPLLDMRAYLSQIPHSQAQKDSLEAERNAASLELARIFRLRFSKYQSAVSELQDLLGRKPTADLKPKLYYNLYKAYEGLKDSAQAEKYKALAVALHYEQRPAGAGSAQQVNTPAATSWYKKAWRAYEQRQYQLSERYAKQGWERFPNQPITAKFSLLQAVSLGRQQRPKAYVQLLDSTITGFAGTREADKAEALKEAAVRILNSDSDDKQKDGSRQQPLTQPFRDGRAHDR